jgi:hypothetical protein
MPQRRWSKCRVVSSGFVVIQRFSHFEGAGGAKWSMSALACAIPTMRTSMAARGKAVRSAVSSGRHEITKGMRKTRSIGQDIERWWKVNEVQIPGTQDALYRAFLDSLLYLYHSWETPEDLSVEERPRFA